MYKCEECGLEFQSFQGKANHYRWQHLAYTFKNNKTKENASINIRKAKDIKFGNWIEEDVKCSKCDNIIHIKYRENQKKERYFCSKSCASKRSKSEETKLKISNSLKKIPEKKFCLYCNKEVFGRHRKFCSDECKHFYNTKHYTNYQIYRSACQFNFSIKDYPNEFDFNLIEQYGWYKAKNHGNNLNGISRDHMFSVKEGFLQGINPEIISHPANCELMRHNDNSAKYKKCSLTLNELKEKIKNWDIKYKTGL